MNPRAPYELAYRMAMCDRPAVGPGAPREPACVRLSHLAPGRPHLVQRALDIPGLGVDPARRGRVERHREALAQRVERGRAYAVVGRQARDGDAIDAALAQDRGEIGPVEARI